MNDMEKEGEVAMKASGSHCLLGRHEAHRSAYRLIADAQWQASANSHSTSDLTTMIYYYYLLARLCYAHTWCGSDAQVVRKS